MFTGSRYLLCFYLQYLDFHVGPLFQSSERPWEQQSVDVSYVSVNVCMTQIILIKSRRFSSDDNRRNWDGRIKCWARYHDLVTLRACGPGQKCLRSIPAKNSTSAVVGMSKSYVSKV